MPPLTRAETYGPLRNLELLADEYYEAQLLDPRRAHVGEQLLVGDGVQQLRRHDEPADPERRRLLQEVPEIVGFAEDVVALRAGPTYSVDCPPSVSMK